MRLYNLILILIYFGILPIAGQTLVSFKVSATGSVIPVVQPDPFINPLQPNFKFPLELDDDLCKDSVTIRSSFSNGYDPKIFAENKNLVCQNKIEVLNEDYYGSNGWVLSPDLAALTNVINHPKDFGTWKKIDDKTWRFESSYFSHSSPSAGPRVFQTWRLDGRRRVKNVIQTNDSGQTTMVLKIFYTKGNLVSRISKSIYDEEYYRGNKDFYAEVHQAWFYDKKKRPNLMVKYSGTHQKLSVKQRELFQEKLSTYIRTGKNLPNLYFDAHNIRDLATYHYGCFGIETVNFCSRQASDFHGPYSDPQKYVTDSIFYNSKGQVVRHSCPKTWNGYANKITFTYDTMRNYLNSYFKSSIWLHSDGRHTETAALLLINYNSNGIINHSKLLRFRKTPRVTEPQLIKPDDTPDEEIEKWYQWL